ncbi:MULTISPECIES: CopG family transcriptional regulator [unclassified Synechococcus]|uniref:ribbon-helix-helix domain-containing protein n=1 Tax=unclassified Synechococcus TaxID=2626047 RepID=UPI001C24B1D8|nr:MULTISPECIES: CopG family transcriptional regulator [unclassified Synechococcus]
MARVELRINDALAADLEKFAEAAGGNKSEVIRRAMTLYALAKKQMEDGGSVVFRQEGSDGEVKEQQILAL